MKRSVLPQTSSSVISASDVCEHAQTPRKSIVMLLMLACLSILFVTLTSGCGQSGVVQAREIVQATPTPMRAAAIAPVAVAAVPSISPERLAAGKTLLIKMGCVGCHTIAGIPEAQGIIGPDLSKVNNEAAEIIASASYKSSKGEAASVRDYLKESILKPSAFVALDCPTGPCTDFVMPRDFKTRLSAEDMDLILDVLSTLN